MLNRKLPFTQIILLLHTLGFMTELGDGYYARRIQNVLQLILKTHKFLEDRYYLF